MSRHVVVERYDEDENYVYYIFSERIGTVPLGKFKAKKVNIEGAKSLSERFEVIELLEVNTGLFNLAQGTVLRYFLKEGKYPEKANFN